MYLHANKLLRSKGVPLKMSAIQHLNGFSTGRSGGVNWSVGKESEEEVNKVRCKSSTCMNTCAVCMYMS